MSPNTPVAARFTNVPLDRGGYTGTVTAAATWTPTDPLATTFAITSGAGTSTWIVGRDLIAAGLDAPAGVGDITIAAHLTDPNLVEMVLRDSRGIGRNVALFLPRDGLTRFLAVTYARTPAGHENYVFDIGRLFELMDGAA